MKFKNILIKSLALIGLIGALAIPANAQINVPSPTYSYAIATNLPATNGYYVLFSTNTSVKIASVQILAGAANAQVNIYDNNITNSTYTNNTYVTQTNYTTNVVYQYVSPLTGMTNNQTNFYLFSGTVTNGPNTNALPYTPFFAQANTMATYNVNLLFSKGIALYANTNCAILIRYRVND